MSIKKMTKEDLELLSNKDITNLILEESKKSINTADLFKKIIKLLELPESTFENKIGDYYTALSTDKRFILLEDGTWDLRNRHTSDKIVKVTEEDDDEEEDIENDTEEETEDDSLEDNFDDTEEEDYDEDTNEELKDLVVIDEDELELEQ
ncbi:MAG: DNA-directed RNA polymerase subunit delta [Mycoplasmatota bacterium]|nr:DNA-directed RNA polymerase subunit delta [Mycoplasmatota bacterium]